MIIQNLKAAVRELIDQNAAETSIKVFLDLKMSGDISLADQMDDIKRHVGKFLPEEFKMNGKTLNDQIMRIVSTKRARDYSHNLCHWKSSPRNGWHIHGNHKRNLATNPKRTNHFQLGRRSIDNKGILKEKWNIREQKTNGLQSTVPTKENPIKWKRKTLETRAGQNNRLNVQGL